MEPHNLISETQEEVSETLRNKNNLNKVTPLSKYLALILFIIMPFVGGWIGYQYAPEKVVEVERTVLVENKIYEERDGSSEWAQYTSEEYELTFNYPSTWQLVDLEEEQILNSVIVQLKNPVSLSEPDTDKPFDSVVFQMFEECPYLDGFGSNNSVWTSYGEWGQSMGFRMKKICFEHNDNWLGVSVILDNDEKRELIDEMLKTVQFIE